MLVDADNLDVGRLRLVVDELAACLAEGYPVRLHVAGHPTRLASLPWPGAAELLPAHGWQRADAVLAAAYVADDEPLVLVTGDGDFALLADRHPGAVLVVGVAGATSGRLRNRAAVVDPVHDGPERLRSWLRAGNAS